MSVVTPGMGKGNGAIADNWREIVIALIDPEKVML